MTSTKDVLDHHLKCFGAGDLQGILSDYTPDAVLFTPEGKIDGIEALKRHFERTFVEFAKPGASFAMKQYSIAGSYAYIVWSAETADNVYEMGTDTFVIEGGRILAQSFAGTVKPKAAVT